VKRNSLKKYAGIVMPMTKNTPVITQKEGSFVKMKFGLFLNNLL